MTATCTFSTSSLSTPCLGRGVLPWTTCCRCTVFFCLDTLLACRLRCTQHRVFCAARSTSEQAPVSAWQVFENIRDDELEHVVRRIGGIR